MKIFAALFFAAVIPVAAQPPQVPHKMEFAGITLTIRDDARKEIQKDVDALTLSPKHYNIKVERAKTYFPIIEKVFAEEQVPDDFKYLSLQESALIADAVSVSNAVGFWQFKDFTALEMGLRVDKEIDERLNIVSSSRAAARYIKKNNTFFNNWIYALQAYQMGAGGVMKAVKDFEDGASRMEITSKTYWYVKKFLAHKIAYEPGVKGKGAISVITYSARNGKTLGDLAKEVSVDEAELRNYNKWTKSGTIPADRTYAVIIPVAGGRAENVAIAEISKESKTESRVSSVVSGVASTAIKKKINGIQTIQALPGESASALASRAGVNLSAFLKWNDLKNREALVAGNFYFLAKKRARAIEDFHKVSPGENLWSVSQQYGVRLKKLRKYNRIKSYDEVSAGTMLWLASTRPKSDAVPKQVENAVAVNNEESFNWDASPEATSPAEATDTIELPGESVTPYTAPEPEIETVQDSSVFATLDDPVIAGVVSADSTVVTTVETPQKTHHVVQAKETLYGIAKIYNIGVMDLVKWNDLDLQQGIKTGQVLRLSEDQTAKNEPVVLKPLTEVMHEVKSSDTLYSIARQYGVTIKEIMDWNEKKDFSLAVGEKLKIQHR
jgi:membrane-bound lytic murein transglycosylase D